MPSKLRSLAESLVAAALPGGTALFRVLSQVDGFLFPQEGVFLYQLAGHSPGDGVIVEIGSFQGRSTLCLAIGARPRDTQVVSIDPHVNDTEQMLRENIRRFHQEDLIEVHVSTSLEVAADWTRPARIVFIDGAHDLESVQADVKAWLPHVIPGGFLLLHDSNELSGFEGPQKVAEQLFSQEETFCATGAIGSTSWGRTRGASDDWSPPQYGKTVLDGAIRLLKRKPDKRSQA